MAIAEDIRQGVLCVGPRCPPAYEKRSRVRLTRFKNHERIGGRSPWSVFRALDTSTGGIVIIKVLDLGEAKPEVREDVLKGVHVHARLDHPYIAPLWLAFREGDLLVLLMPEARGSLRKLFGNVCRDEMSVAKKVILPLLSALGHMHHSGLAHHDVALENVLVSFSGRVMLADLQSARAMPPSYNVDEEIEPGWQKVTWSSRDLVSQAEKKKKAEEELPDNARFMRGRFGWAGDVWGIGLLTWELISAAVLGGVMRLRGYEGSIDDIVLRHDFVSLMPEAQDFIRKCLRTRPMQRPTVEQLYHHPFVTQAASLLSWIRQKPRARQAAAARHGHGRTHGPFLPMVNSALSAAPPALPEWARPDADRRRSASLGPGPRSSNPGNATATPNVPAALRAPTATPPTATATSRAPTATSGAPFRAPPPPPPPLAFPPGASLGVRRSVASLPAILSETSFGTLASMAGVGSAVAAKKRPLMRPIVHPDEAVDNGEKEGGRHGAGAGQAGVAVRGQMGMQAGAPVGVQSGAHRVAEGGLPGLMDPQARLPGMGRRGGRDVT